MFTKYNENWNRGATGEICIRTQEAEIHLSVSINLLIRMRVLSVGENSRSQIKGTHQKYMRHRGS